MRTIIVGDIHGCHKELKRLLKNTSFSEESDRIIFLGDLIDRGPSSWEVVQYVKTLKENMQDRCVLIRGNHEDMLIHSVDSSHDFRLWLQNGAQETIDSYKKHGGHPYDDLEWLMEHAVYYYVCPDEPVQCAHAGTYSSDLGTVDPYSLIWDRQMVWQNNYDGKLIVVGHTPMKAVAHGEGGFEEPDILKYSREKKTLPGKGWICLDSGCVFGYKLTAMVVENGEYLLKNTRSLQEAVW